MFEKTVWRFLSSASGNPSDRLPRARFLWNSQPFLASSRVTPRFNWNVNIVLNMSYLRCQKDSYINQLETKVKSCSPSQEDARLYEIELEDTVLFPGGGGQPDDRGTINSIPVLRMLNKNWKAVHVTSEPFDPETPVTIQLDRTRRDDHMHQHSAQHLISAVAKQLFDFNTTSWHLGEKISQIDFDANKITDDQLKAIESKSREFISSGTDVTVRYLERDDPSLAEVRSHGFPDDNDGPLRVVTIQGLEANMCCGTHVSNLSHLTSVKILSSLKGKKGKMSITFLAGKRVLNYLDACIQREKIFTEKLKCSPEEHVDMLTKIQESSKQAKKDLDTALEDIAVLEAKTLLNTHPLPKYHCLHRREGTPDFMRSFVREITNANPDIVLLVTVGQTAGHLMLVGSPNVVSDLGPKVMECVDGKGHCTGGRYHGKANNLNAVNAAHDIVKAYFV